MRTEDQKRRHREAQRKYSRTDKGKATLTAWQEATVAERAAASKSRRLSDPAKHRGNIEKARLRSKNYYNRHKDIVKERLKVYAATDHGKKAKAARRAVNILVEVGILTRPLNCPTCGLDPGLTSSGKSKIHFHHTDGYEKDNWLVGEWLCSACHGKKEA